MYDIGYCRSYNFWWQKRVESVSKTWNLSPTNVTKIDAALIQLSNLYDRFFKMSLVRTPYLLSAAFISEEKNNCLSRFILSLQKNGLAWLWRNSNLSLVLSTHCCAKYAAYHTYTYAQVFWIFLNQKTQESSNTIGIIGKSTK